MMKKEQNEVKPNNPALRVGEVGHTCVPKYEVSKREILQSLKMAHENLMNKKYKNARMGIGIMIQMLEREMSD